MRLILSILILNLIALIPNNILGQNQNSKEYEIKNGRIYIFGYELDSNSNVVQSDPPLETDTIVSLKKSPNGTYLLISAFFYNAKEGDPIWESWVYQIGKAKKPKKIKSFPYHKIWAIWKDDNIIEIEWGGMGWRKSQIFLANDIDKNFIVDDLLFYDTKKDIVVSAVFSENKINIGPGFNHENKEVEVFNIDLEYEYLSNASSKIIETEIVGNKIIITHTKMNGSIKSSKLFPKILESK